MELVKESIKNLKPYIVEEVPFRVKLDANEGKNILLKDGIVVGEDFLVNIYPDDNANDLRKSIGEYLNVNPENITVGNGSSELIEIIIKTFVDKNESILSFDPSFTMYKVFSQIHSTNFIGIPCEDKYRVHVEEIIKEANRINPKVILLCNPNNPTGYLMDKSEIIKVIESTNAIVVVDEAYMEFAEGSIIDEFEKYPRVIVLRTLSKAFGLAALRVGYMIANKEVIDIINSVKAPYSVSAISQYIAVKALERKEEVFKYVEEVKLEREFVYEELIKLGFKTYKSSTNFIFFRSHIKDLSKKLMEDGILIKEFKGDLDRCCRVTIGDKYENREFLRSLRERVNNENR